MQVLETTNTDSTNISYLTYERKISMKWGIIATWELSYDAVLHASNMLENGECASDVIETTIMMVEDEPEYRSVGYGALPNEAGYIELDAAFMDGNRLALGAVGAIRDFMNPISIARKLSEEHRNNFLVGAGAEEFAGLHGFQRQNMLTIAAKEIWQKRRQELKDKPLFAYDGHDTIGVVCIDSKNRMTAATSTSGLFMKRRGRVGDSPLPGSGLYVDSYVGGATATGVGEDIMKGCLSYEVVCQMRKGVHPQEAAETAVYNLNTRLTSVQERVGGISLVAMDNQARWGIGTNVDFTFVVATDHEPATIYLAKPQGAKTTYAPIRRP
jgi:isoaspartyl peptidase/L-asparaginase-like protein (Ntn-hydrolase superfamily)